MFADQHVHSACSEDGEATMKEMALAAIERGVEYLCFTDHCDLEHYTTGLYDPDCFNWEAIAKAYFEAEEACRGKIILRLGLELGAGSHVPEKAREILGVAGLDFVIGSIHNFAGKPDFCMWSFAQGKYESAEQCGQILDEYIQEHFELTRRGDFDVIGHLGYPLRYMKRSGIDLDLAAFGGELERLFTLLKESGKGLEVNTSGLRTDFGSVLPAPDILKRYRQRGGEIITIGSDAHMARDVGGGVVEAQKLLRELGFEYFTVFKDRKPEFIKL